MSYFQATTKQRSYFHSLTGEWPRRGASKSEVSRLIKKALAGEIVKKPDTIRVYGWRFDALTRERMIPEMQVVKYAVDRNYMPVASQFATLDEAVAFAKAKFPGAELDVSNDIREQYMD